MPLGISKYGNTIFTRRGEKIASGLTNEVVWMQIPSVEARRCGCHQRLLVLGLGLGGRMRPESAGAVRLLFASSLQTTTAGMSYHISQMGWIHVRVTKSFTLDSCHRGSPIQVQEPSWPKERRRSQVPIFAAPPRAPPQSKSMLQQAPITTDQVKSS